MKHKAGSFCLTSQKNISSSLLYSRNKIVGEINITNLYVFIVSDILHSCFSIYGYFALER